jgi:hypothetical protein
VGEKYIDKDSLMKNLIVFVSVFLVLTGLAAGGFLQSPSSPAMAGYADPVGIPANWPSAPQGDVYAVPEASSVFKVAVEKTHENTDLSTK